MGNVMALRYYKCPVCGHEKESLRNRKQMCNHNQEEEGTPAPLTEMIEVISAPNQKFMITANEATGTSKLKDSDKVLKARSRNHSRDILGDETIQTNLNNGLKESVSKNLLNDKGQRRRKIDDI
jgi:hypothetical protein